MSAGWIHNRAGFTLVELLVSIVILGVIMTGLAEVLDTSLASYQETKEKQALLDMARFTMDRMVRFVQEADWIGSTLGDEDWLEVGERVLDTYDNSTHVYLADGDGLLDADNDGDGFVNEDGTDPTETIAFTLDTGDADNQKIVERRPDYSTASTSDWTDWEPICEHVTRFNVQRLADNLVQIELTLAQGENVVSLHTRVKARFVF
jgi:prepilin-type N-terminal cleavage/methylation domain-containing protein